MNRFDSTQATGMPKYRENAGTCDALGQLAGRLQTGLVRSSVHHSCAMEWTRCSDQHGHLHHVHQVMASWCPRHRLAEEATQVTSSGRIEKNR